MALIGDARPIDVVLLGGGASRRMGRDKASLPVAGRRLIDHVLDDLAELRPPVGRVIVVAPDRLAVPDWVLQTMEDPPGGGPVAGLFAGIETLGLGPADRVAVLTCDAPQAARLLPGLFAAFSPDADGAVAVSGDRTQYLLAAYRVGALLSALDTREPHGLSMHRLVAALNLIESSVDLMLAADLDDPAAVEAWLAARSAADEQ